MSFKDHFSSHAAAYAEARSGYPADWPAGREHEAIALPMETAWGNPQAVRVVSWPLLVLAGRA